MSHSIEPFCGSFSRLCMVHTLFLMAAPQGCGASSDGCRTVGACPFHGISLDVFQSIGYDGDAGHGISTRSRHSRQALGLLGDVAKSSGMASRFIPLDGREAPELLKFGGLTHAWRILFHFRDSEMDEESGITCRILYSQPRCKGFVFLNPLFVFPSLRNSDYSS
jgi:hypothetical protein